MLSYSQEGQLLSPYSAYGLGDISPSMFAQQRAAAGVSLGVNERYVLLPGVASSYAHLARPVFTTGGRGRFVTQETATETFDRGNAQFMGLGIGLPIKKGAWGAGFGLIPQTEVGYELSEVEMLGGDPVELNYTGLGGLSKIYVGVAKRLLLERDSTGAESKKLNVGVQMNYSFGNIGTTRRSIFPAGEGFFNTNSTANVIIRDPSFELSAQYHWRIVTARKKSAETPYHEWDLTAGLSYNLQTSLAARRTDLTTSFLLSDLGVEITQDTIEFIDRAKGTITVPANIGVGFGVKLDDKWAVAAEYQRQDWSQFEVDVEGWELPAQLGTRSSFAFGMSYNPSGFGAWHRQGDFFQQTTYRLGFSTETDYLIINGSQLGGYKVSGGFSFPIDGNKGKSRLTLGTVYGSRGNTENGAIRETTIEVFAGFSITPSLREPQWFKKRRIE